MTAQAYALFAAPIGHCGIVWSERGLTGLQPPERDEAATRASMGRRFPLCSQGVARTHMPKAICAVVAAPTALKVPYML
jgi:methylated-DNA-[protein]-cysteine S-methyltransferase